MQYKKSRVATFGGTGITRQISIGGDNKISVQTMWKEGITNVLTDENALSCVLKKLDFLSSLGCDIVRFAVPDMDSADALCKISKNTSIPLVADIHFDYKLALRCIEGNVAKIRINPGNIGSIDRVKKVVDACKDKGNAIRIGVNTGSLPKDIAEKVQKGLISRSEALVETAFREVSVFEELGFYNTVISMKASTVQETVEANRSFAQKYDIPLHIGVTEAGPLIGGIVKSTLAFSSLLNDNIGDTIRVSLSSTPENEVITANEILKECGKKSGGVKIISCPRCGRNGFDVHGFVDRWQNTLLSMNKDITVAVMGCVVNGPGEGKHADIGITGTGDSVIIFKKGKVVRTIHPDENPSLDTQQKLNSLQENADKAFREELESL